MYAKRSPDMVDALHVSLDRSWWWGSRMSLVGRRELRGIVTARGSVCIAGNCRLEELMPLTWGRRNSMRVGIMSNGVP